MGNQKVILSSLAMDLNRVAIGLHRGSKAMAKRFLKEVLARKSEIDIKSVPPYIRTILSNLDTTKKLDDKFADDALMYSTLFQNYALKNF